MIPGIDLPTVISMPSEATLGSSLASQTTLSSLLPTGNYALGSIYGVLFFLLFFLLSFLSFFVVVPPSTIRIVLRRHFSFVGDIKLPAPSLVSKYH